MGGSICSRRPSLAFTLTVLTGTAAALVHPPLEVALLAASGHDSMGMVLEFSLSSPRHYSVSVALREGQSTAEGGVQGTVRSTLPALVRCVPVRGTKGKHYAGLTRLPVSGHNGHTVLSGQAMSLSTPVIGSWCCCAHQRNAILRHRRWSGKIRRPAIPWFHPGLHQAVLPLGGAPLERAKTWPLAARPSL